MEPERMFYDRFEELDLLKKKFDNLERAGVNLKFGENRWLDLIRNASQN